MNQQEQEQEQPQKCFGWGLASRFAFLLLGFLGLGETDDMIGDTSWVDDLVESLFDTAAEVLIGDNGILTALFNLLPVVGNNSMSVEVWFLLAVFGGMLIFFHRFGEK